MFIAHSNITIPKVITKQKFFAINCSFKLAIVMYYSHTKHDKNFKSSTKLSTQKPVAYEPKMYLVFSHSEPVFLQINMSWMSNVYNPHFSLYMKNVCWKCENDASMKLYIYYYFVIIKWDLFIFNMNTFTGCIIHINYL